MGVAGIKRLREENGDEAVPNGPTEKISRRGNKTPPICIQYQVAKSEYFL